MTKLLRFLVLILVIICTTNSAFAQFPYVESFRASTAPGITFGGAPSAFLTAAGSSASGGTPIDAEGNGYLRLTNNAKNQKGYVYSNANFPSNNGLRVEFEYYIYGGTGADGISFFLFDATADPFIIGGFGGSLGYAQITTTDPVSPGVSKGYLAIGLDEFGNFSNPNEGRQGGPGFFPGSVTLRGKGDGAALDPENYKFLTTALVSDEGFTLVGDGGQRQPSPTSTGYRRVLMEMEPNPAGGYNITVKITKGGPTLTTATVINNYYYAQAAPANLRYGFASSTGDQTNFHEVRNVAIEVFNTGSLTQPVAANDVLAVCKGNTPNFDISLNDFTNNAGAIMVNSTIDLNPSLGGQQTTHTIAGRGTFSLAPNGNIIFTPSSLFTGSVSTNYTIKDGYGQTSNVASITINYSEPSVYPVAGSDKIVNVVTVPASTSLSGSEHTGYTGKWSQVSGPNSAIFSNSNSRNTQVNNLINGTYIFRWTISSSGGCESFDDLEVVVNQRPIAVNDNISTNLNTDITIPILANDTDPNGNSTIDNSTIDIKTQPQNGTIVVDGVAGTVIYRPNPGYSGNDSFSYTIKDNFSAESNIATVNIGVSVKPIGTNDNANTTTNIQIQIPVIDNDPGKDGATIIASTDPANGVIVINGDGTITYSPAAGFSGRDSFTYKLKNANNVESDPITVTISVRPKGTADQATTLSGSAVTLVVKDNDLSKTGTTVITTANPTNGTIAVDVLGAVIYTPAAGFSGKDSFSYTLRTVDGLESDPILANINVRPIGTIDYISTPLNVPVDIPVKENDISKSGTTVIVNTNPTHGVVNINTSNIATYTPNAGFSGQDNFTYVLRTADGLNSEPISANINIKPVGTNDDVTTPAATPISIQVKDNDISKAGSSVVINNLPLNGTVTVNAVGEVLYTPDGAFSGKDAFKYLLRTADGYESDPITVAVTVKPVGTADQQSYTLNTPLAITVKDNDLSKVNTTVILNTNPANGTVTVNSSGIITYTPNNGFTGINTFTYILKTIDGIDSDPITVTVTPTATTPTGSPDVANTTTNASITIPVKDNDASQTGTTVVIASNPANGTVTLNGNGVPVYLPNAGFSGKDTFTYKLKNSGGIESDPITVTVNVKPVGTSNEVTTPANTVITIPVKDNDLSKLGTNVIITNSPANGTISVNAANEISYTPSSTFSGKDNLTYILRTADGLESDPISVLINVKPVGSPDNEGYTLNTPKTIAVKDNDISKSNTTVIINSTPANGTVTVNGTGVITYTPNNGFTGTNSFTYILRTADGLDSDPITVTVTPITPQPTGSPDVANTATNTPVTIPVRDNDVSKTGTSVVIDGNPTNGTVVINGTGDPVYTPTNGFSGKDTFTYKLRNNTGGLESTPIAVTVNVKPTGSPDNGIYTINTPLNIDVKNNDLSKNNTTVVINSNPTNGTVNVNATGIVTYTPNTGYSGNDGFTYVLRTADGLNSDPINVSVVATPLPVRPSGSPDVATTPTNTQVTIPIKNNDASGTGTTVTVQSSPLNGTVTINPAGEAVYTPTTGFAGKDTFNYILTNNDGLQSDPITVTVNVKPVGTNDNASTQINNPVTINIKNNDLSKTGTTPVINSNPEHGTVTIDGTGNAVYKPVAGYVGGDSFTYKLRTADGVESDPIIVVVIVTPTSQAPDIVVTVPTDKPITVDVPIPPGGTITITTPPKNGTITFDPVTGKPIYTPNPGYTGPDDFEYVVKDADGNESTVGKVTITVVRPAKIGLAKALVSNVKSENNTFKLTYIFTLRNYGDAAVNQLSLVDNLSAAFPARVFSITKLTASGTLRVNPGFNGTTSTEMLLSSSTLGVQASETIELEVTLTVNQQSGTFLNTATVIGRSASDGTTTSDVSTNGLIPDPTTPGDVSPANPTQAVVLVAPNISVPVSSGQPVTINVTVPPGGSVVIVTPPANGTITFDPATGQPIYTPNPGYSGPDEFTYIIRDANGNESSPGTISVTVTAPAKIGLAKALLANVKNIDGSFMLTYQFTLVNYGDFAIENLSLTDNLNLAFPGAKFEIVNISTTGNLRVNTQYNGNTVLNMLLPTSTLEPKSKEFVEMQLRIVLDKDKATFNNFAVAEGASAGSGTITTDQSTNGFNPDPDVPGNVTPSVLTPVTLTKEFLKIPGGFSPNNDGINDFFVVENSQGKKIELEIFNRWGNRVFKSKDYQNTWNGISNEGIRIGEDLPVGTYYYIIKIEGENKRVGYITINR